MPTLKESVVTTTGFSQTDKICCLLAKVHPTVKRALESLKNYLDDVFEVYL